MRFFHLRFRYIFILLLLDIIALFLSTALAYLTYFYVPFINMKLHHFYFYVRMGIFVSFVIPLLYYILGLYRYYPSPLNIKEFENIIRGTTIGYAAIFTLTFFLNIKFISRMILMLSIIYSIIFVSLFRYMLLRLEKKLGLNIIRNFRILIYDTSNSGKELFNCIVKTPRSGYEIVGFLTDNEEEIGKEIVSTSINYPIKVKVIGHVNDANRIAKDSKIDGIFVSVPLEKYIDMEEKFRFFVNITDSVFYVPAIYHITPELISTGVVCAMPVIGINRVHYPLYYRIAKRMFDVIFSITVFTVLFPIMVLIGVIILLTDGYPAIFSQKRVGYRGKEFTMYKFRTMKKNTDKYDITPTDINDKRITWFGKFLRKSGLDELPQLVNVIKGDMSIVGPRPEMPFIVETRKENYYKHRFLVKPGITGLWQISRDRNLQIHDNIEYDLYYVRNASFFLDMAIIILTIFSFNKGV